MLRIAAVLATATVGVVAFLLFHDDSMTDVDPRTEAPRETGSLRPEVGMRTPPNDVVGSPYREDPGAGVEIRGRVEDVGGEGIPGATLELELRRGGISFLDPDVTQALVADETGAFTFRTPTGGAWGATLTARIADHVSTPFEMLIRPERLPAPPLVVAHRLDATRLVRVVDGNARPIKGAKIRTRENDDTVITDDAGQATVRVSRTFGRLRVVISHDAHTAVVRSIDAWKGEGPQDLEFILADGYGISGVVRDGSGRPVSGVIVRFVGWVRLRTITDANGSFVLNGLDPGRRSRITFRHPDYLPNLQVVDAQTGRLPLDVTLQRGLDVCGRVETADGRPLVGALVTLGTEKLVGRSMRTTGASGEFCVGAPVRGEVLLRVSYPGLVPHITTTVAEPDADPIVVRLNEGNQLGGRVIDESGRGVAGAFIDAYSKERMDLDRWARTDDDGNWLIDGVPDTVHVEVDNYGYIPVTKRDVPTGRRNFDIVLVKSGGVEGFVVDQAGQPVTRFRVALTPPRASMGNGASTPPRSWALPGRLFEDPDGRFSSGRTPLRPDRPYRLEVSADGYRTGVVEPYVPTLQPRNDPITVRLVPGGGTHGLVVDENGRPIEGAVVAQSNAFDATSSRLLQGPRAETDAGGTYTLKGLPTGSVQIEIRHALYRPVRRQVFITRGQVVRAQDAILQPAGGLEVELRLASDMPPTTVVLTPLSGGDASRHPMTTTSIRLPWLRAGRHAVSLESEDPNLDGLRSTVEIVQGRRRRVIFHPVVPRCDLAGTVTIDGRAPQSTSVRITLSKVLRDGSLQQHGRQRTRRDGSFAFPDLEPGQWRIDAEFTRNGKRHLGGLTVTLQAGHAPVQLDLETN